MVEPSNFRSREWRRICDRAGTGHRAMKDPGAKSDFEILLRAKLADSSVMLLHGGGNPKG